MKRKSTEYFLPGHPDRISELIGDTILDEYLKNNPNVLLNLEVLLKNQVSIISGEVSSDHPVDTPDIVTNIAKELRYTGDTDYFSSNTIRHISFLDNQIKEFVRPPVVTSFYSTDETPYHISLEEGISREIGRILHEFNVSRGGSVIITINIEGESPIIESITLNIDGEKDMFSPELVLENIDEYYLPYFPKDLKYIINTFKGLGPDYMNGRITRPYVGRDSSFTIKTGTLLCRHISKHVVASQFAKKCYIEMVWGIDGKVQSMSMDCFGTSIVPEKWLKSLILDVFLFDIKSIVSDWSLNSPIFSESSKNGYFGHESYTKNNIKYFPWECLDKLKYFVPL